MGALSYSAIKAALIAHAKDLAQTLGPKGIRVNTVSSGTIYLWTSHWMLRQACRKFTQELQGF